MEATLLFMHANYHLIIGNSETGNVQTKKLFRQLLQTWDSMMHRLFRQQLQQILFADQILETELFYIRRQTEITRPRLAKKLSLINHSSANSTFKLKT